MTSALKAARAELRFVGKATLVTDRTKRMEELRAEIKEIKVRLAAYRLQRRQRN